MHERPTAEIPRRHEATVSPWFEISAWILAFAVLLAAQCAPERMTGTPERGGTAGETSR